MPKRKGEVEDFLPETQDIFKFIVTNIGLLDDYDLLIHAGSGQCICRRCLRVREFIEEKISNARR